MPPVRTADEVDGSSDPRCLACSNPALGSSSDARGTEELTRDHGLKLGAVKDHDANIVGEEVKVGRWSASAL